MRQTKFLKNAPRRPRNGMIVATKQPVAMRSDIDTVAIGSWKAKPRRFALLTNRNVATPTVTRPHACREKKYEVFSLQEVNG